MNPHPALATLLPLLLAGLPVPAAAQQPVDPATQIVNDQLGIVPPPQPQRERVEVCFVLDTTGSMAGLIDAAKRKIWTIANHIVQNKPQAEIRFALIGYRDRGDAYITTLTPLTADLDSIQGRLAQYTADGGGDTPESVNQALNEAVTRVGWTPGAQATRLIFLVGDAPPHMDYPDDIDYPTSCGEARQRAIRINTLQCGEIQETGPVWAEIAQLGNGRFVQIPQDGNARRIVCPQDAEIARLTLELNGTVLAYGDAATRERAAGQVAAAGELAAAEPETAAARASANASFNGGAGGGRAITGEGDLIARLGSGELRREDLRSDQLAPEFAGLDEAALDAEINRRQERRGEIQAQIAELAAARNAFLAEAEAADDDGTTSFDGEVRALIDAQLTEPVAEEPAQE